MTLPSATFRCESRFAPRLGGVKIVLTVRDVVLDIFLVWALEGPCVVAEHYRRRAINDLNRAMQILWNRAENRSYWTNSTLEITFKAGEASQDLPTEIQNVIGPARLVDGKRPLTPIGSLSEWEQFDSLFLDGGSADRPVAYYIDRTAQASTDPLSCKVYLAPAPKTDTAILLEVVNEAPRFTWEDFTKNTPIPMPHRYAESILLPVVRFFAANFWLYSGGEEKRQEMKSDYLEVAKLIGLADPLPGTSGDNKPQGKEAAA